MIYDICYSYITVRYMKRNLKINIKLQLLVELNNLFVLLFLTIVKPFYFTLLYFWQPLCNRMVNIGLSSHQSECDRKWKSTSLLLYSPLWLFFHGNPTISCTSIIFRCSKGGSGSMTWEVSDREIATVTVKGVVIAGKRRGQAEIQISDSKNILHEVVGKVRFAHTITHVYIKAIHSHMFLSLCVYRWWLWGLPCCSWFPRGVIVMWGTG